MGTYEPSISSWISRLMTEARWGCLNEDVWDVGAYRGYISLLCAKYGKGHVLSIEPFPRNAEELRAHLAANTQLASRIEILAAAVTDVDGEVGLRIPDAAAECQVMCRGVQTWDEAYQVGVIHVRSVRLDSLLQQGRKPPGLIKIDIEGAEALALAGGVRLLRHHRPVVLAEVHNEVASTASIALLREHGYDVRRIVGRRLLPLTATAISYGHLLATPRRLP